MKRVIQLLFAIVLPIHLITAQCDGKRFIDDVFDEIELTKNVQFGSGLTINGKTQDLFMDVYAPANDDWDKRPLVIVAFGGSFIVGSRRDLDQMCEAFAKKGYVAATIDYRLFDGPLFPIPNDQQMTEVVIKAVSDMKGAIRYMRKDADTENLFRIDPDAIIVGGISAGSIVASHTALMDTTDILPDNIIDFMNENGGFDGNTNDLDYSSDVQGVLNYSGGLADAKFIDINDPSFYSVHDEFDTVVPYNEGFASIFGFDIIFMNGSKKMTEVADSVGLNNKLKTIEGSFSHVGYFASESNTKIIIDESARFMEGIICEIFTSTNTPEFTEDNNIYPNPTQGQFTMQIETGSHISIYNAMGQKVAYKLQDNQFDISNERSGIYFIKIAHKNNQVSTKRIILSK